MEDTIRAMGPAMTGVGYGDQEPIRSVRRYLMDFILSYVDCVKVPATPGAATALDCFACRPLFYIVS